MKEVVGLITARGESKTIPRKNIQLVAGKPMIAWTIEAALQSRRLNRVLVSTDDEEIARVAQDWGIHVPFMRPRELARDDSPQIFVVEHAINWLKEHDHYFPNYIMLLQPTSPLRTAGDIDEIIQIAQEHEAISVVSVCEVAHHPFYAKRILKDGTLEDFVSSDMVYFRRQDLPPVFSPNGAIFLNRRESLLRDHTFLPKGTIAYIMPPERSVDVDTPWDFYLVDLILRNKPENQKA